MARRSSALRRHLPGEEGKDGRQLQFPPSAMHVPSIQRAKVTASGENPLEGLAEEAIISIGGRDSSVHAGAGMHTVPSKFKFNCTEGCLLMVPRHALLVLLWITISSGCTATAKHSTPSTSFFSQ